LPGWQRTGDVIAKTLVHDDFRSAIRFVNRVADAAEAATTILTSRSAGTR
jgi:pterin-4a-carbinolamine dehydratase